MLRGVPATPFPFPIPRRGRKGGKEGSGGLKLSLVTDLLRVVGMVNEGGAFLLLTLAVLAGRENPETIRGHTTSFQASR